MSHVFFSKFYYFIFCCFNSESCDLKYETKDIEIKLPFNACLVVRKSEKEELNAIIWKRLVSKIYSKKTLAAFTLDIGVTYLQFSFRKFQKKVTCDICKRIFWQKSKKKKIIFFRHFSKPELWHKPTKSFMTSKAKVRHRPKDLSFNCKKSLLLLTLSFFALMWPRGS